MISAKGKIRPGIFLVYLKWRMVSRTSLLVNSITIQENYILYLANNAILQMKCLICFKMSKGNRKHEYLRLSLYNLNVDWVEWSHLVRVKQKWLLAQWGMYYLFNIEIILYAEEIGLELPKDLKYLPIARQALMAPLPPFW